MSLCPLALLLNSYFLPSLAFSFPESRAKGFEIFDSFHSLVWLLSIAPISVLGRNFGDFNKVVETPGIEDLTRSQRSLHGPFT